MMVSPVVCQRHVQSNHEKQPLDSARHIGTPLLHGLLMREAMQPAIALTNAHLPFRHVDYERIKIC